MKCKTDPCEYCVNHPPRTPGFFDPDSTVNFLPDPMLKLDNDGDEEKEWQSFEDVFRRETNDSHRPHLAIKAAKTHPADAVNKLVLVASKFVSFKIMLHYTIGSISYFQS